jgi:hypothetical protein
MANARPLHLHTVESVCTDLIGGRAIAVGTKGITHSLDNEAARAVLAWYSKNRLKWGGHVIVADAEAVVDAAKEKPPSMPESENVREQEKRSLILTKVEAHRFGGLHAFSDKGHTVVTWAASRLGKLSKNVPEELAVEIKRDLPASPTDLLVSAIATELFDTTPFKGALSHADFEDLSRDLVGRDLGVRFEGFGPGPDGGVDGRHAAAGDKVILQCKHYAGSAFSALSAAMRKERPSIDVLNPTRYILTTSRTLTPTNKSTLSKIIGPSLRTEADILGPADLNTLIRRNPDIERANIKLWLSSTVVLDRVVRAASYRFTAVSKEEIEAKVKVYAPNPSFKEARDKLEAEHVVIISGPPGVGKP